MEAELSKSEFMVGAFLVASSGEGEAAVSCTGCDGCANVGCGGCTGCGPEEEEEEK